MWKAAAIAGWALALLLGQCLVIVLAWGGLSRPTPPPPAAEPATTPVLPRTRGSLEVSRSLTRIRCLLAVGRSQEALAETIACLTLCQRLQIDPPEELPALIAETVTRPPARGVRRPEKPAPPVPSFSPSIQQAAVPLVGRVPGPAYPQASPHSKADELPPIANSPAVYPAVPTRSFAAPPPPPDPFGPPPPPPGEGGPPGY